MTLRERFQATRLPRPRIARRWAPTLAATNWGESTFAEMEWDKSRGASRRWGILGVLVGALLGLILFAPAAWLANAVASATAQRVLLADARGTVWSGSAVAVLTGGPESRDASSLPGRLVWTLRPSVVGFKIAATHACCLNGTVHLLLKPGFGRMALELLPTSGWVGQWPSAWLGGLGTPWNTLQLGGTARLVSPGMTVESVRGRMRITGQADVELTNLSSRLSTLPTLGNYRLRLSGDATNAGVAALDLSTQGGALQLSGNGSWTGTGLRFRGDARAAPNDEASLANLLNIIGRREGARSVILIG